MEKTSYTLTLEVGLNQVSIAIGEKQWPYTIYREDAYNGETIGYFTFSLDAFSLGLGYLIEPIEVPITKGRTAAEELDMILHDNQFTYKSTGSLTFGFYLATIFYIILYHLSQTLVHRALIPLKSPLLLLTLVGHIEQPTGQYAYAAPHKTTLFHDSLK